LPPQNKILYFSNTGIDSIKDEKYYQPKDPKFSSFDAIIAPDQLFQVTIAKTHSIKTNGLKRVCKKLGDNEDAIYSYFAILERLYNDDFKIQKVVNSKNEPGINISGWKRHVFQYALKIKL
jgi:hypothetical protein